LFRHDNDDDDLERGLIVRIDMREHQAIRDQVHAGLSALRVQGRQIWGEDRLTLPQVAIRLMVGVGDLARLARDHGNLPLSGVQLSTASAAGRGGVAFGLNDDLRKELGNIIFSTIRWIDDLGLDVLECLDLAIEAQEEFAKSGRAR
jgi:hypothetical protein